MWIHIFILQANILLMATVNYKFVCVYVDAQGCISDRGIFNQCKSVKELEKCS